MRLLVILSPTDKWGTKTEYTRLRKFLHKDGYIRIAPEVYMRVVQNRKASEKTLPQNRGVCAENRSGKTFSFD